MWQNLITWLEHHQTACVYKKHFGFICPGCGMQTSIIELLKGNLLESIKAYPALIPTLLLFIFLILHLIFKFKKGSKILLYLLIFYIILIFTNYFIKLLL